MVTETELIIHDLLKTFDEHSQWKRDDMIRYMKSVCNVLEKLG